MRKITQANWIYEFSVFILLTLVWPFSVFAQIAYLSQDYKQTHPFIYEIEKDGKVSHILGSMHAGIPLSSFPDKIYQYAAAASVVAFEADPEDFKTNYSQEIREAALYPAGQSLDKYISSNAVQKLKEIYGENGFTELNKYKPWVVANELNKTGLDILKQRNTDSSLWDVNKGIDMTLLRLSKKANKFIFYLDDLSKKVSTFEQDFSTKDLEKLLSYPDPVAHITSCAELAQRFYIAGNENGFKKYNESCETESFLARLQQRTISWIPKMEPLLKMGNTFFVVGADHLNGPNGIEAILEAKGYKIKRMNLSSENTMQDLITRGGVVYQSIGAK